MVSSFIILLFQTQLTKTSVTIHPLDRQENDRRVLDSVSKFRLLGPPVSCEEADGLKIAVQISCTMY